MSSREEEIRDIWYDNGIMEGIRLAYSKANELLTTNKERYANNEYRAYEISMKQLYEWLDNFERNK